MSSFLAEAKGQEWSLPARYQSIWRGPFDALVNDALAPDVAVLDVGCGSTPAVPPSRRPRGVRYVGVDIREEALRAAAPGSFDETYVIDISCGTAEAIGPFDIAVS